MHARRTHTQPRLSGNETSNLLSTSGVLWLGKRVGSARMRRRTKASPQGNGDSLRDRQRKKSTSDGRCCLSNGAEATHVHDAPIRRIGIVEQGPGVWGAQQYLLRLAPFLASAGFDPVLICPPGSDVAQAWRAAGFVTVDFVLVSGRTIRSASGRFAFLRFLSETLRSLRRSRQLRGLIVKNQIDILHSNTHWSHMECVIAGRISRIPTVLIWHEESVDRLGAALRAVSCSLASKTIAVSESVARHVPRFLRHRIEVIRNGVDETVFSAGVGDSNLRKQLCANIDRPLIAIVNRLDPKKGVHHAIEATARLQGELSDAQLVVVGAKALDEHWIDELKALGRQRLGDRIRFVGRRDDIPEVLHNVDVFVLASWHEGLPLGILEAQASEVPVVAYETAGVPEVVKHGVTGIMVPVGDIDGLTEGITRVLSDAEYAAQLCSNARARIETEFTLSQQAQKYINVLNLFWDGYK